MKTYQDFLEVAEKSDRDRMEFVLAAINDHKNSDLYQQAKIAREYDEHRNVTIITVQKLLYTLSGKAIPDNYSANYKLRSAFFPIFMRQETQYLLGNGVILKTPRTRSGSAENLTIRFRIWRARRLSAAWLMASGTSIIWKCSRP